MTNITKHYQVLIDHILALRKLPGLANTVAVVGVESNLGNEALHHELFLRNAQIGNVCFLKEDGAMGGAGVRMLDSSKRTMAVQANLIVSTHRVAFHQNFVSLGPEKAQRSRENLEKNAQAMREEIIKQLRCFSRITKPPRDPVHGKAVQKYSGKLGGSEDDQVICFIFNPWCRILHNINKDRYAL